MPLGLVGAFVLVIGCGKSEVSEPLVRGPRPVILISVDTLRYDHLSYSGYPRETSPRIDELSRSSVHYSNAFATRGSTWPSLTSVMTGLHPISHGVRHNGEMLRSGVPTLAEILKRQGYETGAFLTNYCRAPNRGFDVVKTYHVRGQPHALWDTTITEETLKWLEARDAERPFLLWMHLVSPHADFAPPPPFDTQFAEGYRGSVTGSKEKHLDPVILGDLEVTEADLDYLTALYDGEIAFVDSLVGRVLDELDRRGILDEAVVVFFSDHGEELFEHNRYFYHSCSIYDSVLRVPLLLRLPGGRNGGQVVDQLVSLVDVLPTLLDVTGSPQPLRLEGRSLLEGLEGGAGRVTSVMAEWARSSGSAELGEDPAVEVAGKRQKRIYAIRTEQYKYIYNPGGFHPENQPFEKKPGSGFVYENQELYDVTSDPGEQRNVLEARPDVAARLREAVRNWIHREDRAPARSDAPDAKTREALKALGYVDVEEEKED